jgi:hypothetical protein
VRRPSPLLPCITVLCLASSLAACGGGAGGDGGNGGPVQPPGGGGDPPVVTGLGAAWTTRLAGPRGSQRGLAWTGTRFAAVGSGEGFQSSTDALVWTVRSWLSSADDVSWDGTQMIAVGGPFWVQTSGDGLTWTSRTLPAGSSSDLHSVARHPNGWVAVGESGAIHSSPDGVTWTARDAGTTKHLRSVAWSAGKLVAVGDDGAVVTSADGAAWTVGTPPTSDSFTAVGSSSSLAVATTFPYPGSQSALLTSPDGVTWTPRLPGISPFRRVIHAGGQFVGVGSYSAATSPDGIAWATSAVPGSPNAIVHTGAGYVATGSDRNGAGAVFTSSDGLAWSLRSADHGLVAIARRPSDGLLVVVGSDVARTSADGGATWAIDWLTPELAQNWPFLDVVWSPSAGAFVALVQVAANQDAYRSIDGRTWTKITWVPCHGGLAVSGSGLLVATGSSLTGACIATSDDDGATWTPRTPPAGGRLEKAFWLGGQFVGVGTSGAIATSPDGVTWTPRPSGVTTTLRGAAASPASLVVVGDSGTLLSSTDGGASWTPRAPGTSSTLRRVVWTGSAFYAVGSAGRLLRSPDGATWTSIPTPYATSPDDHVLNDIAFLPDSGGRLVVVGDGGLVATSQ